MAAARRKKKKASRKTGRKRMVCPKTSRGRKVYAAKGGCFVRIRVKKVKAKPTKRRHTTSRRRQLAA